MPKHPGSAVLSRVSLFPRRDGRNSLEQLIVPASNTVSKWPARASSSLFGAGDVLCACGPVTRPDAECDGQTTDGSSHGADRKLVKWWTQPFTKWCQAPNRDRIVTMGSPIDARIPT